MRSLIAWLQLPLALLAFSQGAAAVDMFVRGDVNGDGAFNIADAVAGLGHLFGGAPLDCADALDANDDGLKNIADPIMILGALFSAGPAPVAPFPSCGPDPTPDGLDCLVFAGCRVCVPDAFEPNNSVIECSQLGTISDATPFPAGSFSENFHVVGEEDWFCYNVVDDFGGTLQPRIIVSGIPSGMNVQIFANWTCVASGLSGAEVVSSSGAASVVAAPIIECGPGPDDSVELQICITEISGGLFCDVVTVTWGDDD